MTEDTPLPFDLPAVQRKKVTADFAGGSISSDGGLVLLRGAERRLGLAEALAGCIREWRDPGAGGAHAVGDAQVPHVRDRLRLRGRRRLRRVARRSAVQAGGRPGAGERPRPLLAADHEPVGERARRVSRLGRLTAALVDIFCRSFPVPPAAITLDIDDTCDRGARPSAALAVQRPLRHPVLPPRSTSTTSRAAGRWRFSCAPARRPRGSRSAPF